MIKNKRNDIFGKTKDRKYFRTLFLINFTCSSINTQLIGAGGMFITAYAIFLNIDASHLGKIFSFIALSNILQLISPYILSKNKSRKKILIILLVLKYLCFIQIIFLPVLRLDELNYVVLALVMVLSNCFAATMGGGLIDWNDKYVESNNRGEYYSSRNMISNIISMINTIILGRVLTAFSSQWLVYIIVFFIIILMGISEIAVLLRIPEPKDLNVNKFDRKQMLAPFKDRLLNKYIIFTCVWGFSIQMCQPFYIIYSVTHMKYSFAFIGIIAGVVSFVKIFIAHPCGKIGDRIGWNKVFMTAGVVYPLSILMWAFLTPDSKLLYIFIILVNGISMIIINIAIFNVLIFLTNSKNRLAYIGVNGSLSAVFNFLGAYIGAYLIQIMGDSVIPYINIDIFKVLFIFTGITASGISLYFSRFFGKYERSNGCSVLPPSEI